MAESGHESEWWDYTFNGVIGCSRVSEGCRNCYAEMEVHRYGYTQVKEGEDNARVVWGKDGERYVTSDATWKNPHKWNKSAELQGVRKRVFCASWADVFEDHEVWHEQRPRLFEIIEATPWLDWMLVTKRPQNVMQFVPEHWHTEGFPPNVWIGVTMENQKRADERMPVLRAIPARVRFVSAEPLLGPVNFGDALGPPPGKAGLWVEGDDHAHWIIVGGERGPGARIMKPEWAKDVLRQCEDSGAVPWYKQAGAVIGHGSHELEGVKHLNWPEPNGE